MRGQAQQESRERHLHTTASMKAELTHYWNHDTPDATALSTLALDQRKCQAFFRRIRAYAILRPFAGNEHHVIALFGNLATIKVAVNSLDLESTQLQKVLHFITERVTQVEITVEPVKHEA